MRLELHRNYNWAGLCESVCKWKSLFLRHTDGFLTFGLPLYKASTEEEYFSRNQPLNKILLGEFGDLVAELSVTLQNAFRTRVILHPQLAVPGFHLLSSEPGRPFAGGCWHADSFLHSALPQPLVAYSATLLLGDARNPYGIEVRGSNVSGFFQHQRGQVTLFQSNLLHRIAPIVPQPGLWERLTMQAHLWKYANHSLLFW
jgi:hypothetical protein